MTIQDVINGLNDAIAELKAREFPSTALVREEWADQISRATIATSETFNIRRAIRSCEWALASVHRQRKDMTLRLDDDAKDLKPPLI